MKNKKLLACLVVGLLTGCQTKITYESPMGDKFAYSRPWLDSKQIKGLTVSGDETSREFKLEGYSSNPEWEAVPAIIGSAIEAGMKGGGR